MCKKNMVSSTHESVFGKKYKNTEKSGKNKGNTGYSYMNAFKVPVENYIFLERGGSPLSKNI